MKIAHPEVVSPCRRGVIHIVLKTIGRRTHGTIFPLDGLHPIDVVNLREGYSL